jgi:hypothetical protein
VSRSTSTYGNGHKIIFLCRAHDNAVMITAMVTRVLTLPAPSGGGPVAVIVGFDCFRCYLRRAAPGRCQARRASDDPNDDQLAGLAMGVDDQLPGTPSWQQRVKPPRGRFAFEPWLLLGWLVTDLGQSIAPTPSSFSRRASLVMASSPHASAAPRGRVAATTIPGAKVLLDPRPKAVVVVTASEHHQRRPTSSSCRKTVTSVAAHGTGVGPCKLPASHTRRVMQAGPTQTAGRQNVREPILSHVRIGRRAQPLCVSAARLGVPSR